jgi:2,5-diamino-6-(ribosylamino)-4(3H)-pyrimidinone 5'-phosphate reductase
MTRPRVICHMLASVDGRILTDNWPLSPEGRKQYELVHESYDADGWLCGRVTMQLHFASGVRDEADVAEEHRGPPREDFVAPGQHASFAFVVDPRGRLLWESGEIEGDHVVAILSERVSDEYLSMLRESGVSYLLTGPREVDLSLALDKIGTRLGLRTLMLEGGGAINGSMLRVGLVDEVSVLVAPIVDGRVGSPSVFDIEGASMLPRRLALEAVEQLADDVLWLRYRVSSA